jgi:hypothetical protein
MQPVGVESKDNAYGRDTTVSKEAKSLASMRHGRSMQHCDAAAALPACMSLRPTATHTHTRAAINRLGLGLQRELQGCGALLQELCTDHVDSMAPSR